ncbi:MAG: serine/threonine protein kinase [Myxococcales bacterium]|nr:serine/threonine protein kinase [Myxococcales bacterium]
MTQQTQALRRCRTCAWEGPELRCPRDGQAMLDPAVLARWPDDPLLGTALADKYLVVDVIGEGGFGAVYRAIQVPVQRPVAVKVIRAQADGDLEQVRARFFREAKAIGRLRGDRSVSLHDYGEDRGTLFMVMELVAGETLFAVLTREGRLPPARAAGIALQILEALAEAHELGLVHRDIKPENVMLARTAMGEDRVKVLDFGITKMSHADAADMAGDPALETAAGVIVGTPAYMAPEQWHKNPGPQSDLYAVGVLLYRMLAGRTPFQGKPIALFQAHTTQAPPALDPDLGLPVVLERAVMRALEKTTAARFQNAAEMAEALRQSIDALAAGEGLEEPPARPLGLILLAGLAAAALAAGVVIWLAQGSGPQVPDSTAILAGGRPDAGVAARADAARPDAAKPDAAKPDAARPDAAAPDANPILAAPESAAPESAAPESAAPESAAPESAAPESAAPESAAPESAAPESAAPESAAPESAAPESAAPESAAPESAAPASAAPESAPADLLAALVARIQAGDAEAPAELEALLKQERSLRTPARKALYGQRRDAALRFLFPRRGPTPTLGRY